MYEKKIDLRKDEQVNVKKHLSKVKRQLYRNALKAYYGWWCWFCVCRTRGFCNTAVILIPGEDAEISYLSLLYLDQMLDKRGYDNAIVLTHDSDVIKAAPYFSDRILSIKYFSREKAEAMMAFYCFEDFNSKFVCASLDEPLGRDGTRMIGQQGVTKETIFVICVYGLYPVIRPIVSFDNVFDLDVKNFIDRVTNRNEKL